MRRIDSAMSIGKGKPGGFGDLSLILLLSGNFRCNGRQAKGRSGVSITCGRCHRVPEGILEEEPTTSDSHKHLL